jgi:hypothetical protein
MLGGRKQFFALLSVGLCALLLSSCASPPWVGMSESEIAAWKAADFGPDQARGWYDAGFSADEANAWKQKGFAMHSAVEWHKDKFTADEAASWKAAGMDTEEAIENRDQGLMPIPASDDAEK